MTTGAEETMIAAIARLIADPSQPVAQHIAVGAASPIPAAACWLVKKTAKSPVRLSLLHKVRGNPFTDGTRELFDLTGQGRIDLFFLGGGQIDGQANINLIGTGDWPGTAARFPGSFGSAFMYMMVPRTILFREEHSSRVFVPKVDIVSAPGTSPPGVYRRGTAQALVTGKCVFAFDAALKRFRLVSVHAGETVDSVRAATGFEFDAGEVIETSPPTEAERALLRGAICDEMLETYPSFCERVWGRTADAIGSAA